MFRIAIVALMLWPVQSLASPWVLDRSETRIAVDVRYLGNTVVLHFDNITGTVDFDAQKPQNTDAEFSVVAADVETGLGIVNAFVRSRNYLNTDEFPEISFRLERLVQTGKSTADIFGSITLLGQTRPTRFKAEVFRYGPASDDPTRFEAGFNLTGSIDRLEFGNSAGIPQVAQVLPIRIRFLMASR